MELFFGMVQLMGVYPKPEMQQYWSRDHLLSTPFYPDTMPRDRFEALLHNLHFNDNEGDGAGTDKFHKLRPVIDHLTEKFRHVYTPHREICVDESLWKFKGRHHLPMFNAPKRARSGFKVCKLCQSRGPGAGFVHYIRMYDGCERGDVPAGTKVVREMMDGAGLFDKGYL
jgi:hypothetical protein